MEIIWGLDGGCGSSRGKVSESLSMIWVGALFVLRGTSSGLEESDGGCWREAMLKRVCGLDISFPERIEPGVSALEVASLMGEIDLARSVLLH